MLKLGIIGTGAISHDFVTAAHLTKEYKLTAVYSRTQESANAFVTNYPTVTTFTDWKLFLASDLDVVYIASPNAIHFEQTKDVLLSKKHAIVEKPAFSTPKELENILKIADENGVYCFEAARHIYEQAYQTISEFLVKQTILGAQFSYAKYSSKMPDYLAGNIPNVFSPKFSGGALMDLGIYPIYSAIKLFGSPISSTYSADLLKTGVDGSGDGTLNYSEFHVNIKAGKTYDSYSPAEIYTTTGTLVLNHIQQITSAIFYNHSGHQTQLDISKTVHGMFDEAKQFSQMINNKNQTAYKESTSLAVSVAETLYTMRQSAGIRFEADL